MPAKTNVKDLLVFISVFETKK